MRANSILDHLKSIRYDVWVNRYCLRRHWAPETPPESSQPSLLHGIKVGKEFHRRLTRAERLAIAIAGASPRRHLTLGSRDLDREGVARAWCLLRQRVARARRMPDRLVYFAVPARSADADGYHLHCLLWGDYLHRAPLIGHAKAAGFGEVLDIQWIGETPWDRLGVACYVLGQCEPVFGQLTSS
jgi:hypothetical protein